MWIEEFVVDIVAFPLCHICHTPEWQKETQMPRFEKRAIKLAEKAKENVKGH